MRYLRRVATSRPLAPRLTKASAPLVALVVLVAAACTKARGPDAEPYVKPAPSTAFAAPQLRPVACADAPAARGDVPEGCEQCAPGEHCKRMDLRGRVVGVCAKSTCAKDADCPGALCACGPPNECVPGNCRGPEDCGGRECAPDRWRYGHGTGTYCRTDRDECATHAHCGKGHECAYVGGRWACRAETPAPPPG